METQNTPMFKYPPTRLGDTVDDYFGTVVPDPYRWLEDENSKETRAWGKSQNTLTRDFLDKVLARQRFLERLKSLLDYTKYGVPVKKGGLYFFTRHDGTQNQPALYTCRNWQAEPTLLLDPNRWSEAGTIALTSFEPSFDGKLLAYTRSKDGSDWQEIYVRDVERGVDHDEVLQWCKFAGIAWHPSGTGFFYDRYPANDAVPAAEQFQQSRVYWHQLGTPQADDRLIYEAENADGLLHTPVFSDDGQILIIYVFKGTNRENQVLYRPVAGGEVQAILPQNDAMYRFIDHKDGIFYFHTDQNAERGRIIAVDSKQPEPNFWCEILAESEDTIASVTASGENFAVTYMRDAYHLVKLFALDGAFIEEVHLPQGGSIAGISAHSKDEELYLLYSSFLFPPSVYRFQTNSGKLGVVNSPELDFDIDGFETHQYFAQSKDGTAVPLFVTHKKGLILDGSNPTILFGYGGFSVDMLPAFSAARLAWIEAGGVFVQAVLRGGNEYGDAWHRAGMRQNKQNVFDDFISVADWLIDHQYTSSSRLAIYGGSNGGLLVSACMVQRPELFGAVLCAVPVTDMLRYHHFTIGSFWIGEYGSAENSKEEFDTLMAYSPLHNIVTAETYPPILILTADSDDRVVPAHAMKLAATLQAKDSGKNPILLRVESQAGHGLGKPTSKILAEFADIYAFLWQVFEMEA